MSEIAGFAEEYFKLSEDGEAKDNQIFFQGYRSILTSKGNEDSLVSQIKAIFLCFIVIKKSEL